MERTWRWFGKKDKITLAQLKQIGVEGIVTALHDVPLGEVWTREKIHELKEYIESYGMKWSVVESLPVVETLKYGGPENHPRFLRKSIEFSSQLWYYYMERSFINHFGRLCL